MVHLVQHSFLTGADQIPPWKTIEQDLNTRTLSLPAVSSNWLSETLHYTCTIFLTQFQVKSFCTVWSQWEKCIGWYFDASEDRWAPQNIFMYEEHPSHDKCMSGNALGKLKWKTVFIWHQKENKDYHWHSWWGFKLSLNFWNAFPMTDISLDTTYLNFASLPFAGSQFSPGSSIIVHISPFRNNKPQNNLKN